MGHPTAFTPKAFDKSAQGNTLGNRHESIPYPERVEQKIETK